MLKRTFAYTLVEAMIALALGTFVLIVLITILLKTNTLSITMDNNSQQIENGRYALQVITRDINNAGYFANFNPVSVATPANKPNPCTSDLQSLRDALPIVIQGYHADETSLPCINDVKSGTDILMVKHVNHCNLGEPDCDNLISGGIYFQASSCTAESSAGTDYILDNNMANFTLHLKNCVTIAPVAEFLVHIYYIANNDISGDGVPTLKIAELHGENFSIHSIASGIENLKIVYGIDNITSTTGSPSFYTSDPDSYQNCDPITCTRYWRNVVSTKLYFLVRDIKASTGYRDVKTYQFGFSQDGTPYTQGPFFDAYHRHVYSSTALLYNVSGRNRL